jgi:hypothetical protein
METAKGTFEISMTPTAGGGELSCFTLEKVYAESVEGVLRFSIAGS